MHTTRLGRPLFWVYTGGLFVLGAVVGTHTSYWSVPWTSIEFLSVWAWFTVGENFFGALVHDYYGQDSNVNTLHKSGYWGSAAGFLLWGLIIFSGVAFGVLAVKIGGLMLWAYVFSFFLYMFLYTAPPVRLKGRYPFDLLIGPACALPPLFGGYSLVTHLWPPFWMVVAGVLLFSGLELLGKRVVQ